MAGPAQPNLPPDVIRLLSFHGPVDVVAGAVRDRAAVAPFEESCTLLLRRGSPVEAALLATPRVEVHARDPGGAYSLRLVGRAHAGLPLPRHPERAALEPWVPEGTAVTGLLAVPFVPERVELSRDEDGERVRYFGATPAGRDRPGAARVWLRAAFPPITWPFALAAVVVPWVWLGVQGPEFPQRPLVLLLAVAGGLAQVVAARLLTLDLAFRRWREGRADEGDAGPLVEAHVAPGQARLVGLVALGLALVLPAAVATWWSTRLAAWTVAVAGGWLLGPAWWANLGLGGRRGGG